MAFIFFLFAFQDPTAEDTMVVQLILASRMGTRELESDEEDENAFEVPREQLSKFTGKAPPTKLQLQEAIEKAAIEADKKQNNNSSNDSKDDKNDSDATPVDEKKVDGSFKPDTTEQVETKKLETEVEAKTETDKEDEKMDVDKEISSNEEEKTTNSENKEETKENDSDKPEKMEENDQKPSEKAEIEKEVSEKPAVKKPLKPLNKTARMIEVEEYLVKFKNFSYLHCQWLTEEELHRGDKRISQKIKRFKQKREKSLNLMDLIEDEHFNPDYIEVDRVLDSSTHTDEQTNVMTKHFLVKWRSLPYEDCTWELESDVDPNKIKEYIKWKDPPAEDKIYKRRYGILISKLF